MALIQELAVRIQINPGLQANSNLSLNRINV